MPENWRKLPVIFMCFVPCSSGFAEISGDAILGLWITAKGKAYVEISKENEEYTGEITWLKEPFYPADDAAGMAGDPKVDRENPNPNLQNRPVIGLRIMEGFHYEGDGQWTGGTIYDPEKGKTYKSKIRLTPEGTLKVRGFIGISLFGRTEEWLPVTGRNK